MATLAPAWDNERTSISDIFQANNGQRDNNAWGAKGGKHDVDLCQPALAAAITRDAERLCSLQVCDRALI